MGKIVTLIYIRSGGFSLDTPENLTIKLHEFSQENYYFARVNISVDKATHFIFINPENLNLIPYKISNKLRHDIIVGQKVKKWTFYEFSQLLEKNKIKNN